MVMEQGAKPSALRMLAEHFTDWAIAPAPEEFLLQCRSPGEFCSSFNVGAIPICGSCGESSNGCGIPRMWLSHLQEMC